MCSRCLRTLKLSNHFQTLHTFFVFNFFFVLEVRTYSKVTISLNESISSAACKFESLPWFIVVLCALVHLTYVHSYHLILCCGSSSSSPSLSLSIVIFDIIVAISLLSSLFSYSIVSDLVVERLYTLQSVSPK